jgi:hypothetical protein
MAVVCRAVEHEQRHQCRPWRCNRRLQREGAHDKTPPPHRRDHGQIAPRPAHPFQYLDEIEAGLGSA